MEHNPGWPVSRVRNSLKKSPHQGQVRISPSPYTCGCFGRGRTATRVVGDILDWVPGERSTHAGRGFRRKALTISPPALGSELFMRVIFEKVD